MKYNEMRFKLPSKNGETACAIASMLEIGGIYFEDYSDMLDCEIVKNVGLIDDELLKKDTESAVLHVYLPENVNLTEAAGYLSERFAIENIPFEYDFELIDEKDYADSWKQYYKPLKIGKKIVVVPEWESYEAGVGEIVLRIDPGMAFGTGTHETTSLCIETLQNYISGGDTVLDIGCGSGILSITSLLLGAGEVTAYDIDQNAVKVTKSNAALNEYSGKLTAETANILDETSPERIALKEKRYNIIVANIVADIIIRLCEFISENLEQNGVFISSGIISERSGEVRAALEKSGFVIIEEHEKRGWICFVAKTK